MIYPLFNLFLLSCQIHQNLPFLHKLIYEKSSTTPNIISFIRLSFSAYILSYSFHFLLHIYKSKVGDLSRGWPEGSLFNSYFTEVLGRALLHSQDCSLHNCVTSNIWPLSSSDLTPLGQRGYLWKRLTSMLTMPRASLLLWIKTSFTLHKNWPCFRSCL